LLEVSTHP